MASVIEEIRNMQGQGLSEDKIISNLRERGVPHKDIIDALSRTKIKAAVTQSDDSNYEPNVPVPSELQMPEANENPEQQNLKGMQKSIMTEENAQQAMFQSSSSNKPSLQQGWNSGSQGTGEESMSRIGGGNSSTQEVSDYPQEYYDYSGQAEQGEYPSSEYDSYSGYGSYSPNMSSDVVSEISEQVVSEKISEIRKGVEKIIDFKTTMEAKVESLSERLKRIEKVIDTLQTSVLRKTGDYMTNVDDIKREIIETQKTFGKLLPEFRKELEKDKKPKSKK